MSESLKVSTFLNLAFRVFAERAEEVLVKNKVLVVLVAIGFDVGVIGMHAKREVKGRVRRVVVHARSEAFWSSTRGNATVTTGSLASL